MNCDKCDKELTEKQAYRLSWRYTDKKHTYRKSNRHWIHTGYMYLCRACLKQIVD